MKGIKMSELKYYKLLHRVSSLASPELIRVVEFHNDEEVYFKLDVDKVIESKDRELRHYKYKRSMEMVKKCVDGENQLKKIKVRDMNNHQFWKFNNGYWKKWHNRWIKISEKFKPNSIAL